MIYSSWNTECDRLEVVLMGHHHMCTMSEDHMMHGSWDISRNRAFVILGQFLPFDPPDNPKNQNFEKMKKVWRYYRFTFVHHKWYHMMYASWNMECNRHSFLSFWAIFCPFTLLKTPKIEIWKIYKKTPGHIILLHMCSINEDMIYGSWDIKCNGQSFCNPGPFFALWPS